MPQVQRQKRVQHDRSVESPESTRAKQSRWRDWQAKQVDSFNKALHRPTPGGHYSKLFESRWSGVRDFWNSRSLERRAK